MTNNLKEIWWRWRGVLVTTPLVTLMVILLRYLGLLQILELQSYDYYYRLRQPIEKTDDRIVIVGIDDADLKKIGSGVISDGVYAKLINKLKAANPRAIGLDIYRDVAVEPGHVDLMEVFKSTPNLIGIEKVVGKDERDVVPPPRVLKEKNQVGANDLIFDPDGKVRRGFFYVANKNGENVFSFSFYLALLYLEKDGIKLQQTSLKDHWQIGKTLFSPFVSYDGGYVGVDDRGYQVIINYRGPNRTFAMVSMREVLNDTLPANWGKDKIILIGVVGASSRDKFFTPYNTGLISIPQEMPGVEIHANLISQIISSSVEGRSLIKSWPEVLEWIWIAFWAMIGSAISWYWRYAQNKWRVWRTIAIGGSLLILILSSYLAFNWGWWIPLIPAMFSLVGASSAIILYMAYTAVEIRQTFGRYLSDEVVATLLESPSGLDLGGSRRKMTILTSDLRGFTALSELLSPEEVVKILNIYLKYMTDVVINHQGTINGFMGDGILILFGAPINQEDDAIRAVACAIEMQLTMTQVNEEIKKLGYDRLKMGIGINTGIAVAGNIGSEKRTVYSVIGSEVNLAFRIETYTSDNEIFISESTYLECQSVVKIGKEKKVKPKGVKQAISIYEVVGIAGKYNLDIVKEQEVFCVLPDPIPVEYAILEGKHIDDVKLMGKLIKLSNNGAAIALDEVLEDSIPEPLKNIQLNLLNSNLVGDIYAKVMEEPLPGDDYFYIRFTMNPPVIAKYFKDLYGELVSSSSL